MLLTGFANLYWNRGGACDKSHSGERDNSSTIVIAGVPQQSKLNPYLNEILALRQQPGMSYQKIAGILEETHPGLKVSHNAVWSFLRTYSKTMESEATPASKPALCQATMEKLRAIAEDIAAGLTDKEAAWNAEIHPDTYYEWCKTIPAFTPMIERAKARRLKRRLQIIEQGLPGWQSAAWLVSKTRPEQFGDKPGTSVNVTNTVGVAITPDILKQAQELRRLALSETSQQDFPAASSNDMAPESTVRPMLQLPSQPAEDDGNGDGW
jgi:hypothetical protein